MKLVMITDYRGAFRQGLKSYLSMNKESIKETLLNNNIEVTEYTYEEIVNDNIVLKNENIIYTSTQNQDYKSYIDDVLYHLSKENNLIPRYEIFKAHENKGYQEFLKTEVGIESLDSLYFGNLQGLGNNIDLVDKYPVILKKVNGAGSANVYKLDNRDDLLKKVRIMNKPKALVKHSFKQYIKKHFFKKTYSAELNKDDVFTGPFILQEFVSGLEEDWKVLVFGSKYYVLNRKVRANDFRASGSGKLSYSKPPVEVLEFANEIFNKLDIPCVSLDITHSEKGSYLIEYQGLHFGPYTIINSDHYYEKNDTAWNKITVKSELEKEFSNSIVSYLNEKKLL